MKPKKQSLTMLDAFAEYNQRRKKELAILKEDLEEVDTERLRMWRLQIRTRGEAGKPIPRFIEDDFNRLKRGVAGLKRKITEHEAATVDKETFRAIIGEFNLALIDVILEGYEFSIPSRLGRLSIKKSRRRFDHPTVDWPSTKKLERETGKLALIYYTNEWIYRWYWAKHACNIPNKSVYMFHPTVDKRTKKGARNKLHQAVVNDEFAHLRYETAYAI